MVIEKESQDNVFPNGFTKSAINQIDVTNHAISRIKKRLNIQNTKNARQIIKEYLSKSTFVGVVIAEDGNESILYTYNKVGIYLSTCKKRVITVNEYNIELVNSSLNRMNDIKEELRRIQMKKFRKLNRAYKRAKRQSIERKLDNAIELAQIEKRLYKTKSNNVKIELKNRIKEIESIAENEKIVIANLEKDMRILSKSICALHNEKN